MWSTWPPNNHRWTDFHIQSSGAVPQQLLNLPSSVPNLGDRLSAHQPDNSVILDVAGIGSPLRFDDEHAAGTNEDMVYVAVPCEVDPVDQPPALPTLSPTQHSIRRRLFPELAETSTMSCRQGFNHPGEGSKGGCHGESNPEGPPRTGHRQDREEPEAIRQDQHQAHPQESVPPYSPKPGCSNIASSTLSWTILHCNFHRHCCGDAEGNGEAIEDLPLVRAYLRASIWCATWEGQIPDFKALTFASLRRTVPLSVTAWRRPDVHVPRRWSHDPSSAGRGLLVHRSDGPHDSKCRCGHPAPRSSRSTPGLRWPGQWSERVLGTRNHQDGVFRTDQAGTDGPSGLRPDRRGVPTRSHRRTLWLHRVERHEHRCLLRPPPPTPVTTPPAASTVTFGHYGVVKAIPTSLLLPCAGTGNVYFVPLPMSPPTSKPAVVPVTYVGQP